MGAERAHLPRVLFVVGSLEAGGSEGQLVALLERIHGVRVDARLAALVPATDRRLTDRVRTARGPARGTWAPAQSRRTIGLVGGPLRARGPIDAA